MLKRKALSRTYVQSYNGLPLGSWFNSETGDYSVRMLPRTLDLPNRVYINEELFYPNGYDVSCIQWSNEPV